MSKCVAGKNIYVAMLIILLIKLAASLKNTAADCERYAGFSLVPPIDNWSPLGNFFFGINKNNCL